MAGIDEYTVLMLHCDGADASTTFTDSSASAHTVTSVDDVQIDTAQKKFGTASGLFDGTLDHLDIPDSSDWHLASGDFTIDCWIRFNALPPNGGEANLFYQPTDGSGSQCGTYIYNNAGTYSIQWYAELATVYVLYLEWTWTTPTINTWYHVAVVRYGSSWKAYVDGVSLGEFTDSSTMPNCSSNVEIGILNGWLDEYRVSKGIARWTANFTPPTEAYSKSQYSLTTSQYESKSYSTVAESLEAAAEAVDTSKTIRKYQIEYRRIPDTFVGTIVIDT